MTPGEGTRLREQRAEERRREADVLQAVQTIVPQAVRIVRMRGGIAKGVKYED